MPAGPDSDQIMARILQHFGGSSNLLMLLNALDKIDQATGYGQVLLEIDHRRIVQINETVKYKTGKNT
jgi:hypothetical protein